MVLHGTFRRCAAATATGLLAVGAAAGTAYASGTAEMDRGPYKGRVIAKTGLNVRTGPSTHHRVVDVLPHGTVVKIRCKVNGQWIDGNPRWYKLADGRFAKGFSSARYIKNIGPAPHFCHKSNMVKSAEEQAWKQFGQPVG